jgi:hypothetical protein
MEAELCEKQQETRIFAGAQSSYKIRTPELAQNPEHEVFSFVSGPTRMSPMPVLPRNGRGNINPACSIKFSSRSFDRTVMPTKTRTRPDYDFPTAVTFLLIGLAIGSVLSKLFSPLVGSRGSRSMIERQRTVST